MKQQELLVEAQAAVDSEPATAVEAHHKAIIKGLLEERTKLADLLHRAHAYIQLIDDGTEEGWS